MGRNKDIELCFYCGRNAESRDHVPPKCLLLEPFPENLVTIPACKRCNNGFSRDEEYFLNVLVEIGTSELLVSKKENGGTIYRARLRRPALYERIKKSFVTGDDGRIYITPEQERIKKVFEKIALGLYWHKYKQWYSPSQFRCFDLYTFNIFEQRPADIFLMTYTERFMPKKWTSVQPLIFSYIIVKNWKINTLLMIFSIHDTIWGCIELPQPLSKRRSKKPSNQMSLF